MQIFNCRGGGGTWNFHVVRAQPYLKHEAKKKGKTVYRCLRKSSLFSKSFSLRKSSSEHIFSPSAIALFLEVSNM